MIGGEAHNSAYREFPSSSSSSSFSELGGNLKTLNSVQLLLDSTSLGKAMVLVLLALDLGLLSGSVGDPSELESVNAMVIHGMPFSSSLPFSSLFPLLAPSLESAFRSDKCRVSLDRCEGD